MEWNGRLDIDFATALVVEYLGQSMRVACALHIVYVDDPVYVIPFMHFVPSYFPSTYQSCGGDMTVLSKFLRQFKSRRQPKRVRESSDDIFASNYWQSGQRLSSAILPGL